MTTDTQHFQHMGLLHAALIKLIKLIKTIRFYPPEHPTLKQVSEETLEAFRPLLQDGPLALSVRKDCILHGDKTCGQEHAIIRSLAHFLFARRIQQLLFLPELTARDLVVFCRNVTFKPSDIQEKGGLQELLLADQATGIWINELDLSFIRAAKQRIEHRDEQTSVGHDKQRYEETSGTETVKHLEGVATETNGDSSMDERLIDLLTLEQILTQLPREASDRRFKQLLDRLPKQLHQHLAEQHLTLVLQTFRILASLFGNRKLSKSRRSEVLQCLNQLSEKNVLDFLIYALCTRGVPKPLREQSMQTLVFLREKTVRPLINRLAGEKDALARKLLSTTLAKQGTIAIPDLVLALQDEHWYMVRNVVAILGQIGESRTASHLHPLLWHEDLRIARETVRALARLGGEQAVKSLLQLVDSGHRELYPQAIIALGIMRNPAAVPSLVKIIKTRDPFMKKTELKTSAIKALGRIGAPEAATELEILAKRRPLWGRAKRTSLRIQAIAALGQIGSPSSKPVLEALTHERDQRIAHSALRIMKQWPEL